MKKIDLLKVLATYADDQEILVEASDGGFDDPVIYISAVHARAGHEFKNATNSEYLFGSDGKSFGAVILGTAPGLAHLG